MKRKRYSEEQIIAIPKEHEAGPWITSSVAVSVSAGPAEATTTTPGPTGH